MKQLLRAMIEHLPCQRQVFRALKVLHPPKAVYSRLRFRGDFRVNVNGQGAFLLRSRGHGDENQIFWRGLFCEGEAGSLQLWVRLCREAGVIFDVGANWGLFSLVAAAVNPAACVFGFEPVSPTFRVFQENAALNKFAALECIQAAVGAKDGATQIFFHPDNAKQASLNGRGASSETVPALALDSFIRQRGLPGVNALKIDVETFEPEVLQGLAETLPRSRPALLVEVLNDDIGARLAPLLPDGYRFFHIDESGAPPQRHDHIRRLSRASRNWLFCPPETARRLLLPD
jgi:FkbM family methyltransferase